LATLTLTQLNRWAVEASAQAQTGQIPVYIPGLATVDRTWFAAEVRSADGSILSVGSDRAFTLMSVIKPFLLLCLLEQLGSEVVFAQVGVEPSDQSFHSIPQLLLDQGFPRNPMLNSGAIALAALLPGDTSTQRCEYLRNWLNRQAGTQLGLDRAMLASVRSLENESNWAIANVLAEAGRLDEVATVLDTYNHICCLAGTVATLAQLGLLLAKTQSHLTAHHQKIVNAVMLTCGLYEASGKFAVRIGLPMKSGVSGALLAVVPGEGTIACYSPALDATGNSIAGLFWIEQIGRSSHLSLFEPKQ
jgi:glutaminase